ncbi:uncharacterized protein [Diabrotica undecimpunctata]|uniref:uncharacterized protein n=1 Tax=Diabrotica undecimpunctata TaxID=50387 RepID=UPI003B63D5B3
MHSFFKKKPQRRWRWQSPNGKTQNEIVFITTNEKHTVKDTTVLNRFVTSSVHRIVRGKIEISLKKERYKMIQNKNKSKPWMKPSDVDSYHKCISDILSSLETENNISDLNNKLTNALLENQNNFCPRIQKEEKISQNIRQVMQKRREMSSEMETKADKLQKLNKEISQANRQDSLKYKQEQIEHTIKNNRSMKVLRKIL